LLARAIFFRRLGESRDRSYQNQRYRTSGLNLVVAVITIMNLVPIEFTFRWMTETPGPLSKLANAGAQYCVDANCPTQVQLIQ
jgi:hypothetical protein